MNHTLFISDLHLQPERPDITENFFTFLRTHAPQAEALYILGDLFEAWVGNDNNAAFNQAINQAILTVTQQGVPVYFMRGNRDFLIGEAFAKTTGSQILPDPSLITLYDNPVLLTHGDLLCTQDGRHQLFRKISQHPACRVIFLKLPLWLRRRVARLLRGASRKHTQQLSEMVMDVDPNAVVALMQQSGVSQMIHGHTHRPAIHQLVVNEQSAQRIVLGDWDKQAHALIYYANGEYLLENITLEVQTNLSSGH